MQTMKKNSIRGRLLWLAVSLALTAPSNAQEPAQQDPKKVAAGAATYSDYCSTCHGDDLLNSGRTYDLRRFKAEERPRFENSVLNGKNQMPPWKGVITPEQIDTLWAYIRANAYEK